MNLHPNEAVDVALKHSVREGFQNCSMVALTAVEEFVMDMEDVLEYPSFGANETAHKVGYVAMHAHDLRRALETELENVRTLASLGYFAEDPERGLHAMAGYLECHEKIIELSMDVRDLVREAAEEAAVHARLGEDYGFKTRQNLGRIAQVFTDISLSIQCGSVVSPAEGARYGRRAFAQRFEL